MLGAGRALVWFGCIRPRSHTSSAGASSFARNEVLEWLHKLRLHAASVEAGEMGGGRLGHGFSLAAEDAEDQSVGSKTVDGAGAMLAAEANIS